MSEHTNEEVNLESQIELLQEQIALEKSLRADVEKVVENQALEIESLRFQLRRARQRSSGRF